MENLLSIIVENIFTTGIFFVIIGVLWKRRTPLWSLYLGIYNELKKDDKYLELGPIQLKNIIDKAVESNFNSSLFYFTFQFEREYLKKYLNEYHYKLSIGVAGSACFKIVDKNGDVKQKWYSYKITNKRLFLDDVIRKTLKNHFHYFGFVLLLNSIKNLFGKYESPSNKRSFNFKGIEYEEKIYPTKVHF